MSGNIVAPTKKTDWFGHHVDTWLSFNTVNGLTVSGNGKIDGNGRIWWTNACIGSPVPVSLLFMYFIFLIFISYKI